MRPSAAEANMVLKRIIPVTAVALLLIAFAVVPALALLPTGQQAPDFQLNDLSNQKHSLSDYRGKVVVIDFFGADCGACKSSATDDLVPLYNNYYRGDARVQFLSVETSGASAAYTSSNFVQPTSITWPVLVGGTNLVSSYGIPILPTVYVIDSTGKVALAMQYPVNVQTLKSTIDQFAVSGQPTQLSLSPSTTAPTVGQSVTFTATLNSGTTPLSSKSVTIYHYLNNVRYTDTTKTTDANGQIALTQSFGSAAQRPYYATFAGDSSYQTSTSSVV
ncbi:MAG: redoxin domain-containing protein, partial [Halobacteriota archaeon]